MEIYKDNMILDLTQVSVKDFRNETLIKRENLPSFNFSSISMLKGEKNILGLSFDATKKELLD